MKYGLLGETLTHSLSPLIHQGFGNEHYGLFPIPREGLADFLETAPFFGCNVTIPYKEKVIPYCDELSLTALTCGNVNTLSKSDDGSIYGDNTDYHGFKALCDRTAISLTGKYVVILGSGGAAKTVAARCEAENAAETVFVSRSLGAPYASYSDKGIFRAAEIIINATPVGMFPHGEETPIDISLLNNAEAVIDLIYNPMPTKLLKEATARGIKTADGLWMLIEQARLSEELFQKRTIDPALNEQILTQTLQELSRNKTRTTKE